MKSYRLLRSATAALLSLSAQFLAPMSSRAHQDVEGRTIREIRINELRHTREELVRTQLCSQVGATYSEECAHKDAERLDRLRIFSDIEITPIADGDGVVIQLDLQETIPYIPTLSIEVTEENGFAGGPGFKSVNFRGRAIAVSTAMKFGRGTNFDLIVEGPWRPGRRLAYALRLFHRERPNPLHDFEESSTDIDLRLGTNLGENGRIGGRFSYFSLGSDVEAITLSADGRDEIPSIGFFVGYDSRDRATDPRRGDWHELEVWKRGGVLGGETDYWTLIADVRRYLTFHGKHTALLSSLLTLQSGELGEDVPVHQDFHLGGTNTVRGYGLDSLRGKNQWIQSAEYRYRLLEPTPLRVFGNNAYLGVQLATFVDWGLAWTESSAFGIGNSISGYGVGLRLLVPFIDMVRLDLGWGESGGGVRFHVGIFEKAIMQRARVR